MRFFNACLVLMCSLSPALACGPFLSDQGHYNLFDRRVVSNPLWNQCFNIHVSGDYYTFLVEPNAPHHDDKLRQEWDQFAKELHTDLPLSQLIFCADKTDIESAIQDHLQDKPLVEALTYILFTMEVAPFTRDPSEWTFKTPAEDESRLPCLLESLQQTVQQVSSPFLRMRYGYQLVRLATIMKQYDLAIRAHQTYVAPGHSVTIRYLSLGQMARALLLSGQRQQAAGIYCEISDQYPDIAYTALRSLKMMALTVEEWTALEAATTDKHKKASIIFMHALQQKRDYAAETLAKLVDLEPGSDRTEALLVRMIHAVEHYNIDADQKHFFETLPPHDRYTALIELCAQAGANPKIRQPALWYVAGAHLALLSGKAERSAQLLSAARAAKSTNPYLLTQLALDSFLLDSATTREPLTQQQRDVAATLLHSYKRKGDINAYPETKVGQSMFADNKLHQSLLMVVMQRLTVNDPPLTQALFKSTILGWFLDRLGDPEDWGYDDHALDTLENMLSREPDALSQHLQPYMPIDSHDAVIHYRAMLLMREEDYEGAKAQLVRRKCVLGNILFSRQSPEFTDVLEMESSGLVEYCDLMLTLQKQVKSLEKTDVKAAVKKHEMLGNIKYTMELDLFPELAYGTPRDYSKKPSGQYEYYDNDVLQNFRHAEKHYQRIIDLNVDRELAAKACVLVQAARNEFLYHKIDPDNKVHTYYYTLAKCYADTKFYQEFSEECPSAKLFL